MLHLLQTLCFILACQASAPSKDKSPVSHVALLREPLPLSLSIALSLTVYYRKKPKETSDAWPPKYHRASMTLTADDGSVDYWAFMDARRLGRVKLIDAADPRTEPPLSLLG